MGEKGGNYSRSQPRPSELDRFRLQLPRGSYDAPKCTYFPSSTTLAQRLWPLYQKGRFLPLDISVREDIDIVQEHGATLWVLGARLHLNLISTVLFLT